MSGIVVGGILGIITLIGIIIILNKGNSKAI
jgi:hypothetical protein